MIELWQGWAKGLKRESISLYLAMRDPRTPWYAKVAAACVVAYALSPIDLVPDPIPVLGYLDDLVIVPLGILIVRRMIPRVVLDEARVRVDPGEKWSDRTLVAWARPSSSRCGS